ncbi:MAG: E3 binding domain-containing protein, partial [Methylococcales bacterium]|nr:E3 binding domain-containing protein [Methylococcales bacterium]
MTVLVEIKVPDVGDVKDIDVVEVLIQAGDTIEKEQTIATLETDKASIDLPASVAGKVQKVHIKAGDKVSEGSLVVTVEVSDVAAVAGVATSPAAPVASPPPEAPPAIQPLPVAPAAPAVEKPVVDISSASHHFLAHATPSVRLFARELGVDLSLIKAGSGRKGRILQEDVKKFVKQV